MGSGSTQIGEFIDEFTDATLPTLVLVLFTNTDLVNAAIAKLFAHFRGRDGGPVPSSAPETSPKEYTLSK